MPVLLLLFLSSTIIAQDKGFVSIHQLQNEHYKQLLTKNSAPTEGKSIGSIGKTEVNSDLQKRVFGYHPYWSGDKYLNYQWELLSDLSFFSYEVDPATGNPVTTHNWENAPVIDTAITHGVKVHLCVTLFSDHADFFGNAQAKQTLIDNIINLIEMRGAHGVNMDVEALPSSQSENFNNFIIDLSIQVHDALPDAEVSIAAPAVNWSDKFDIPLLNEYIDFFMVMAYDYYWSGATEAGPVSPLYSMVDYYSYNFSKTISYYQHEGVPAEKILTGVPYYAYQWPTETGVAPSATTGSATAYTYSYVKNNSSGNYSLSNKHREENSFGPYFAFEDGGWYQCWIDDVYSMGEKYDIVNRRGLGGIGIWALGYDDGYTDFWDLINEKFTEGGEIVQADTLYDSGGPSWDYNDRENYRYTITTIPGSHIHLAFSYLNLEEGYDTLWIYDGPDTTSPLVNFYNGDSLPESIISSGNTLTFRFKSDNATTEAGWRAVYDTLPVSSISEQNDYRSLEVFPNPAMDYIWIKEPALFISKSQVNVVVVSSTGKELKLSAIKESQGLLKLNISELPQGLFILKISDWENGVWISRFTTVR
ncbi:MAG: hypothetical protein KDC05_14240 [Bacteroidales bacterium]|nr:hypothetical protein [Bacteroidales bacterium]